jgi:UDP-N-acetylmuramate: L-alanyl-gamma-D-glutamyl-meso-diaminopimelate ligase
MNLVPGNGRLIVGVEFARGTQVPEEMEGKLFTKCRNVRPIGDARWQARYIDLAGDMTRFTVFKDGNSWGEFETHLIGNSMSECPRPCMIAADRWGSQKRRSQEALHTFKSVKRRMEVRGTIGGDGDRRFARIIRRPSKKRLKPCG